MKIVKIMAWWCQECAIMRPRWQTILKQQPALAVEDIDYDEQPEAKKQYEVKHLPTVIFLADDGRELHRLQGLAETEEILSLIKQYQAS